MKKIFAFLLLGIITNETQGRYEYSWNGQNLLKYGPNNDYAYPLPEYNPPPVRPIPEYIGPVPEYIGPTNDYYTLPPYNPRTLPPIPYDEPTKYLPTIPVDYPQPIGSSRSSRYKRQTNENSDDDLEDKYGWDRPRPNWPQSGEPFGPRPWQRPNRPGGRPSPPSNGNGQTPIPNPRTTAQPNQDSANGSTTADPATACMSSCPVTSEYNPVCGSNGVTYPNPGRLICAQMCGVNVNLFRQSTCPTTTTTAAPAQN